MTSGTRMHICSNLLRSTCSDCLRLPLRISHDARKLSGQRARARNDPATLGNKLHKHEAAGVRWSFTQQPFRAAQAMVVAANLATMSTIWASVMFSELVMAL